MTVDGVLNVDKICDADPPIREVLSVGASWIWVPRPVFKHYVGLDAVAQSSGNYLQNASKSEHDGQIIFKVIRQIEAGAQFDDIKAQVMKSRVKHVESLPGMFNFLRKYGSLDGRSMDIAMNTAAFIRGECDSSRHVEADMWDRLSADIKGTFQHIRLRHGALAIMYADKNSRALTAPDLKALGNKDIQEQAARFEAAIEEMTDSVMNEYGSNNAQVSAEIVRFSAACFALLFKKTKLDVISQIVAKYKIEEDKLQLGHLQWHLLQVLSSITNHPNKDTEFAGFALSLRPAAAAKNEPNDMPGIRNNSIDNTGTLLTEAGWKVGQLVQFKSESVVYKITKFADGKVHLASYVDAKKKREAPATEFQSRKWKISKVVETEYIDAGVQKPHQTAEYDINLVRSMSFFALHEAQAAQAGNDKCIIQLKPKKHVEVTDSFAKGALSLAPASFRIDVTEASKCSEGCETFAGNSLFLGSCSIKNNDYNVFAAGITSSAPKEKSNGMQAPFWEVAVVHNESEANCALTPAIAAGTKIKSDKIKNWLNNDCKTADVIKVPMIVSTKALKKGDTLKVFAPNKKRKIQ